MGEARRKKLLKTTIKLDESETIKDPIIEDGIKLLALPPTNFSRKDALEIITSKQFIILLEDVLNHPHVLLIDEPIKPVIETLIKSGQIKTIICSSTNPKQHTTTL